MTNRGQAARAALLAYRIAKGRPVTARYIRQKFGASPATAKRDMALLARLFGSRAPLRRGPQQERVIGRPERMVQILGDFQ
jgi:predicted DNA-binding transcriptional regulator YafY